MNQITSFKDDYAFLSNFYKCLISYEGMRFPSVEHAYQAMKTETPNLRNHFTVAPMFPHKLLTPSQAKYHGKSLDLRRDWEQVKVNIMYDLLKIKFNNAHFRMLLEGTGTAELIEGNWWGDTFWGVCKGKGENRLGKLLMRVRMELIY